MVTAGIFPFKENSHGTAGNPIRDLMISSQRLWPLDHEAGLLRQCRFTKSSVNTAQCGRWTTRFREKILLSSSGRKGTPNITTITTTFPQLLADNIDTSSWKHVTYSVSSMKGSHHGSLEHSITIFLSRFNQSLNSRCSHGKDPPQLNTNMQLLSPGGTRLFIVDYKLTATSKHSLKD